jgi:hypothetical protein
MVAVAGLASLLLREAVKGFRDRDRRSPASNRRIRRVLLPLPFAPAARPILLWAAPSLLRKLAGSVFTAPAYAEVTSCTAVRLHDPPIEG